MRDGSQGLDQQSDAGGDLHDAVDQSGAARRSFDSLSDRCVSDGASLFFFLILLHAEDLLSDATGFGWTMEEKRQVLLRDSLNADAK